jgi:hypothetical protein
MKSDCSFTEKLITFGNCNKDLMSVNFSDKETLPSVSNLFIGGTGFPE